jgi:hypothetical protein
MVGYIKHHFFVRYRKFDSFAHMNQLALQWLTEEADVRLHGTVKEVVRERFLREVPALGPIPRTRYDTSYHEHRRVEWDGYIDVGGNRYSAPDHLRGTIVPVSISLDGVLVIFEGDRRVAEHRLRQTGEGWGTIPDHHVSLWNETLHVEHRDLSVYEEVLACN